MISNSGLHLWVPISGKDNLIINQLTSGLMSLIK